MGAPGGAIYLGKVLGQIAQDFGRLSHMLRHGIGSAAAARLEDFPLLIKALAFRDKEMRQEAHQALTRLVGEDLGTEPEPWNARWRTHGAELMDRRHEEAEIERLFADFKASVLDGRWEEGIGLLDEETRERIGPQSNIAWFQGRKKQLRQAYRDAAVSGIDVQGTSAELTVDWGKLGFETRTLALKKVAGKWVFGSPPWGGRVTVQPKKPIRQYGRRSHVRLRPERFSALGMLAIGVAVTASVMMSLTLVGVRFRNLPPLPDWLIGVLFFGSLFAPLAIGLAARFVARVRRDATVEEEAARASPHERRLGPGYFNFWTPLVITFFGMMLLPLPLAVLRWVVGLLVDTGEKTPLWLVVGAEGMVLFGPLAIGYSLHRRARQKWLAAHPTAERTPAEEDRIPRMLREPSRHLRRHVSGFEILPAVAFGFLVAGTIWHGAIWLGVMADVAPVDDRVLLLGPGAFVLSTAAYTVAGSIRRKAFCAGQGRPEEKEERAD